MKENISTLNVISWLFALLVFAAGVANLFLVHPVPGIAYLLISLVYIPPVNDALKSRFGFSILPGLKIVLGIVLIMFTLGVSDLGDIIDKL